MKKYAIKVTFYLFVTTILFLVGLGIYHSIKGNEVAIYPRFQKSEGKSSEFNWCSPFFPIQFEYQKLETFEFKFDHRVKYPIAPKFNVVHGIDSSEIIVANEIADFIYDSLHYIQFNLGFDLDGQSLAVRTAKSPWTLHVNKAYLTELNFKGTASPEALKYGLEKSLQPGAFEPENANLAKGRLELTDSLTKANLAKRGVDLTKTLIVLNSEELQLDSADVKKAMTDSSILDEMRYVQATIKGRAQRLIITPVLLPIGFLFWILLLLLLISFFSKLKFQKPRNIKQLWWLLALILGLLSLVFIATQFGEFFNSNNTETAEKSIENFKVINRYVDSDYFILFTIIVEILFIALLLWAILWIIFRNWKEFIFFLWALLKGLWWLIRLIVLGIMMALLLCLSLALMLLAFVVLLIVFVGVVLIISWREANWWQRILVVHLILDIIAFVAWLMGVWTPTFL